MARAAPKPWLDVKLWLALGIYFVPIVIGAMIATSTPEASACLDRMHTRGAVICLVYDFESWRGIRSLLLGLVVASAVPAFFIGKDYLEGGPQKRKHRRELDRARRARKRAEREALKLVTQKNSKGA